MGIAVIGASFISMIGFIIILELNNRNWFKKENWKLTRDFSKQKYRIDLKKMEKDLGITTTRKKTPEVQITPDIIKTLVNTYLGGNEEEGEQPEGLPGMLMNFAEENPELVQQFLKGITKGKNESGANENLLFE
jgi:hypothetical protein